MKQSRRGLRQIVCTRQAGTKQSWHGTELDSTQAHTRAAADITHDREKRVCLRSQPRGQAVATNPWHCKRAQTHTTGCATLRPASVKYKGAPISRGISVKYFIITSMLYGPRSSPGMQEKTCPLALGRLPVANTICVRMVLYLCTRSTLALCPTCQRHEAMCKS